MLYPEATSAKRLFQPERAVLTAAKNRPQSLWNRCSDLLVKLPVGEGSAFLRPIALVELPVSAPKTMVLRMNLPIILLK
jgi:hypothetical protein